MLGKQADQVENPVSRRGVGACTCRGLVRLARRQQTEIWSMNLPGMSLVPRGWREGHWGWRVCVRSVNGGSAREGGRVQIRYGFWAGQHVWALLPGKLH